MEAEKYSFSINKLLSLYTNQLPEDELDYLNLALQSLAKRLEYCEYHYQEYLNHSTPKKLVRERSGISYDRDIRVYYEANFLAFLNNLQCIVDSAPYALNIMYRVSKNGSINDMVDWRKDHINLYRDKKIFPALEEIINSNAFDKVRALSNRSKHKHLTPILNDFNSLTIDSFCYKSKDNEEVTASPTDANEFMRECHAELIPLIINLFNKIIEFKETELDSTDRLTS